MLGLADSPKEFVAQYQREDLTVSQLAGLDDGHVTSRASIRLAQILRSQGLPAIQWEVWTDHLGCEQVRVNLMRSNYLPYHWEVRRRERTEGLIEHLEKWSVSHDLYETYVQCAGSKVSIEEVRGAIKETKLRLRQLNKSVAWSEQRSHVIATKYELVVDVSSAELQTYAHGHVIFAVPKASDPSLATNLVASAAKITGLNFGHVIPWEWSRIGYLAKHPFKIPWPDGKGYLVKLKVAANLPPTQALRIYQSTRRIEYVSKSCADPSRGEPQGEAIPVPLTDIPSLDDKDEEPTGQDTKKETMASLSITGLEFLHAYRNDPGARKGVEDVLTQLGLSYWVGPDQDRDGSYGVVLSNGLSSSCDTSWPDEEQLSVFLKQWPSRIWEKAYAAGRRDAKFEIRKAIDY